MTSKSAVRRRFIGKALHHYRTTYGFTVGNVAELLDCDPSKVSRIETGQRGLNDEELRELLAWYGASEDEQDMLLTIEESTRGANRNWWQDYPAILSGARMEYVILEQHAARVLIYAPQTVPELLQTADYAEALAAGNPKLPEGRLSEAAEVAQLRQRRLVESGRLEVEVVIGAPALLTRISDETIQREQLSRIFELASDHWWVTVRVLQPPAAAYAAQGAGAFSILRFDTPYSLGLVHVDGPGGGLCLDDQAAIDAYAAALIHAQSAALSPADSLEFIRRIASP